MTEPDFGTGENVNLHFPSASVELCGSFQRSSSQPTAGRPKAGRPEAARGEERGIGKFDGLAASTATTVRKVGINKTE